jgi:hypothetical protein
MTLELASLNRVNEQLKSDNARAIARQEHVSLDNERLRQQVADLTA